ncbi:hypothetical protein PPERSA_04223 [Pseudocohnilembus persalinus]|uniref:Tubulin-tyrosine ligase/Tubulin polyglutamylase n=1 Tax=Pseudocohnilembus persalinus TaxID=266149 RepID=A0A0V0QND1_PSEPJ|nr:hypothetical protein PPERSA_04223 [Pseudocohnilembus persalinus]|eukprot:KRX03671.1 hypothetical protein PPERSA_04223 [Pseudocohnilembus persalinus]
MDNSKQNVEQDQQDDQMILKNNEDQKQEQKNNDQSHQNQNVENHNKQEKPPFSIMTLQQLVDKPRKIRQHKKITIDLTKCQYEILREVAQLFNWNIIDNSENYENEVKSDFNIKWYDSYIQEDQLRALLPYQKINRFPGSNNLGRKNLLAKYLIKLQKVHPEDYSFFPRTWLLPNQLEELRSFTQKCNFSKYLIVKPENQSQGKGIYLTKKIDKNLDSQDHFVIQEYITNPYLIDNLKFDLRIYVLLKSVCPLKIFIYKEGLVRFATQEYAKPNKQNQQNLMMHLTNYAINKKSDKFQFNTNQDDDNKGHKRSLSSFLIELQQKGINVENLWDQIKQVVVKTFCSCIPNIQHIYKSCQPKEENNEISFELFGFDIFLDEKLKPYLLEVNHTPSFSTDTPLDHQIKKSLILDTLILENIMWKTRVRYFDQKNNANPSIKGGSNNRMSKEDIQIQKEKRITWEQNNIGGYEQIYPELYDEELQKQYDKFKQSAQDQFDQFSGANIQRAQKKEYKKELPPIKINGANTNKFTQNQQSNKTTNNNQNAQKQYKSQLRYTASHYWQLEYIKKQTPHQQRQYISLIQICQ